jgi:hypothetical protein
VPGCWKRRFSTPAAADRAVKELEKLDRLKRRKGKGYTGAFLGPYPCETCGGFHIGHRSSAPRGVVNRKREESE